MHGAFGFHVYAGGLAVGVARHFELLGLGEHGGYGDAVKALNFPEVPLFPAFDRWPRERGRGARRCRFAFANPPCAPFSVASAGRATAWHQDPRLAYFRDVFELLPDVEPDVMAVESVTQAWLKGRNMVDGLAKRAAGWGYSTTVLLHNARFVGNVQNRQRAFFVFHRIAVDWDPPDFGASLTVGEVLRRAKVPAAERRRFAEEAELTGFRRTLWERTPPGGNMRNVFDKVVKKPERGPNGNVRGRPGFLTYKLNPARPALVFIGGNHILHPTEPRALYPSEINAVVGFPPGWRWPDWNLDRIARFASQGVSPHVGEWFARGVARSIDRGRRINRPSYVLRDELRPDVPVRVVADDPGSMDVPPFEVVTPPPPKEPRPVRNGDARERPVRTGSGAFIRELLVRGVPTDEILRLNRERFPASKATASDVAWNRGRLRKEGVTT
jgi:site-specific DNA-cytosine methylase